LSIGFDGAGGASFGGFGQYAQEGGGKWGAPARFWANDDPQTSIEAAANVSQRRVRNECFMV